MKQDKATGSHMKQTVGVSIDLALNKSDRLTGRLAADCVFCRCVAAVQPCGSTAINVRWQRGKRDGEQDGRPGLFYSGLGANCRQLESES
jgi:hypothetical protein